MTPNIMTSYLAIQEERKHLSGKAERGWLAEEAAMSQPRRSLVLQIRQRSAAVLLALGTRLEGAHAVHAEADVTGAESTLTVTGQ